MIGDRAFEGIGNVTSLTLLGVRLGGASARTFIGLSSIRSLRLQGSTISSITPTPMLDEDPFGAFENLVELTMDGSNVRSFSHQLFAGLSLLEDLEIRCVPILRLDADVFSPRNKELRAVHVTSCPDLEHIEP